MPRRNEVYFADTLDEIRSNLTSAFRTQFPTFDLSPESALGGIIEALAQPVRQLSEDIERVQNSLFIRSATGTALDKVALVTSRRGARRSEGSITFTLPALSSADRMDEDRDPFRLPAGTSVGSAGGFFFTPIETVQVENATRTEAQEISFNARATEVGEGGNVAMNGITGVGGLAGITIENTSFTGGSLGSETDLAFRERLLRRNREGNNSSVDGIIAAVSAVSGVQNVQIYVNNNDAPDRESELQGHTLEVVVKGSTARSGANLGNQLAINRAIYSRLAAGIGTHVRTTIGRRDEISGIFIAHTPVQEIDVTIAIKFNTDTGTTGSKWDANSEENIRRIRERVFRYVGGTFRGVTYEGVGIGESISTWVIEALVTEQGGPLPGVTSGAQASIVKAAYSSSDTSNRPTFPASSTTISPGTGTGDALAVSARSREFRITPPTSNNSFVEGASIIISTSLT